MMKNLLFEIGTEELPANYMPRVLTDLQELAAKKFTEQHIPFESVTVYGTPRRLALLVHGVAEAQADTEEEFKGPSVQIAFKDGAPTKAAMGFARGKGVDVGDLTERDGYVYAVKRTQGKATKEMLPAVLEDILHTIPFPNHMRWADFEFRFLRPVRWLVALFDTEVIPVAVTDVRSGRETMGHRFLSHGPVSIPSADDYVQVLKDHFVLVDQEERRERIRKQITELAREEGGEVEIAPDLLEEVTYLVEYPTALCGRFEEKYLRLPEAAIITPMRDHQRYFPVRGKDGRLLNKFIAVRNGGKDFLENVIHGNERVLRARLADAEFFFNEDRKKPLAGYAEKTKTVVFQEGLGNMYDKSQRLVNLVEGLHFVLNSQGSVDDLKRAAALSKCDLVTGMVTEFTELQGIMGRDYARLDGEPEEVAVGIAEQYQPRFAGDVLPRTEIGRILSLADKIDNITATFSRGKAPTGSQDPFGMRRQALGILNILLDGKYHLGLRKAFGQAIFLLHVDTEKAKPLMLQISEFLRLRFRNMLLDQGIRYDVIDAVLADGKNDDPYDLYLRARALQQFVAEAEAPAIVQAAVRVHNLCGKITRNVDVAPSLFREDAETALYEASQAVSEKLLPALVRHEYGKAALLPLELTAPVNRFFDEVMVMDKEDQIKDNRLALLANVQKILHCVGDLSKLVLA